MPKIKIFLQFNTLSQNIIYGAQDFSSINYGQMEYLLRKIIIYRLFACVRLILKTTRLRNLMIALDNRLAHFTRYCRII